MLYQLHHSFENFGLHSAALRGDEDGVLRALESGADINSLDHAGRTALMCAVASENWEQLDASDASFVTPGRIKVIQTLTEDHRATLYTLNAPHHAMNGVTPLGMAAWLNTPKVVHSLLSGSRGSVSVNGMDSHGATALMYATRDGNMEVAQILLSHGARPDFRDRNHRTSIQFSIAHPEILWLCEHTLRLHRAKESKSSNQIRLSATSKHFVHRISTRTPCNNTSVPPPLTALAANTAQRLTPTLIQYIISSDLSSLLSLLFPLHSSPSMRLMPLPLLVNQPDSRGWSPIHHCMSVDHPSVNVLDALYCAGAEISLFTTDEYYTPLHCLAKAVHSPDIDTSSGQALYQFTVHLVRDLQAPLSARDRNDETCIHIAAEHGTCIDILLALLDCDTTGYVREIRNARGLTALEVAKPEFRAAFAEGVRSASSLSSRTIRPLRTASLASIVSYASHQQTTPSVAESTTPVPYDGDISIASHQLLGNLHLTSPIFHSNPSASELNDFDALLRESTCLSQDILRYYRAQTDEASKELQEIREAAAKVQDLFHNVLTTVNMELLRQGLAPIHLPGCTRGSEDSETTAVPSHEDLGVITDAEDDSQKRDCDQASVAVQTVDLDTIDVALAGVRSMSTSWFDFFCGNHLVAYQAHLAKLTETERELSELKAKCSYSEQGGNVANAKIQQLLRRKRKEEKRLKQLEHTKQNRSRYGTGRWITWFKRKNVPELSEKCNAFALLDCSSQVGREVKPKSDQSSPPSESDASLLRNSQGILATASRDLSIIGKSLVVAEQILGNANQSISRADRAIGRALKQRILAISEMRGVHRKGAQEDMEHSPSPYLSVLPSYPSSARSSCISLTATLAESEDEDIRVIRRLLLRKIEANLNGTWNEINHIGDWLAIVKEAVKSVKRRANT